MIPTAEDTLRKILSSCNMEYYELEECCPEIIQECLDIIINQNKLYVQAALFEAKEKAETITCDLHGQDVCNIDEDSILNAYPLTNIK